MPSDSIGKLHLLLFFAASLSVIFHVVSRRRRKSGKFSFLSLSPSLLDPMITWQKPVEIVAELGVEDEDRPVDASRWPKAIHMSILIALLSHWLTVNFFPELFVDERISWSSGNCRFRCTSCDFLSSRSRIKTWAIERRVLRTIAVLNSIVVSENKKKLNISADYKQFSSRLDWVDADLTVQNIRMRIKIWKKTREIFKFILWVRFHDDLDMTENSLKMMRMSTYKIILTIGEVLSHKYSVKREGDSSEK